MSFRRRAGGGRRDSAEQAIVEALEAYGVRVWKIGGTGNPDLLCLYRGVWVPLEVKSGPAGRLTRNQQDLVWPVVRNVDEAIYAFGALWRREVR